MIQNRTFMPDGTLKERTIIDLDAGTFTREESGEVVESRPLTLEERQMYGPQPLDSTGALATLLAVTGTVSVEDAANSVGLTPEDLINEALAWSAAQGDVE
jgi:hypothetical protein